MQDLFLKGAQLYTENQHEESINVMELSLKEYLIAEDECRYLCEGPTLQLSNEDLYVSITSTYENLCSFKLCIFTHSNV